MQYMNKQIKKILIVLLCLVLVIGIGVIRYIHYQNSAIVICIDAGHGGYDTGAIAADGTYEKSLTLAYAKSDDKASKAIYKTMAQNLSKSGWEYDRGIETTTNYPLYVVDNLSIPSMLVEVGFITNKNELQDLEQSTYRKTICKAIANAYISYIQKQSDD